MKKENYIDEVLRDFKKEICELIPYQYSDGTHRLMTREEILWKWLKQKLQEVEQRKVDEIRKELRSLNWTIDDGRFGNILNDKQIFGIKSLKTK